jgi:hypothetical protein
MSIVEKYLKWGFYYLSGVLRTHGAVDLGNWVARNCAQG